MSLTSDQAQAIKAIHNWKPTRSQCYTLSGAAGTGKTFLLPYITESLLSHEYAIITPTNIAAQVARSKGVPASTLHALIYQIESENPLTFVRRPFLSPYLKLIIVDECFMVSDAMRKDLESYGTKILYIGDGFQLPPVQGLNTLRPNSILTTVTRQALESQALRVATYIREKRAIPYTETAFKPTRVAKPNYLKKFSQIIVGYNRTRNRINENLKPHDFPSPQPGDRIICLTNRPELGIYNGSLHVLEDISHAKYKLEGRPGWIPNNIWRPDADEKIPKLGQAWDWAYSLTCHKAQGSEFPSVGILYEPIGDDAMRWLYTAVTRTKDELEVFI